MLLLSSYLLLLYILLQDFSVSSNSFSTKSQDGLVASKHKLTLFSEKLRGCCQPSAISKLISTFVSSSSFLVYYHVPFFSFHWNYLIRCCFFVTFIQIENHIMCLLQNKDKIIPWSWLGWHWRTNILETLFTDAEIIALLIY